MAPKASKAAMKSAMKKVVKPAKKTAGRAMKAVAMKSSAPKKTKAMKSAPVMKSKALSKLPAVARASAKKTKYALQGLKAIVINLDRRADRWTRCEEMFKKETPWLEYERFSASDGRVNPIPDAHVCHQWNTKRNAVYSCDYDEWVYDQPGTELDGVHWRWPRQEPAEDDAEWGMEKIDSHHAVIEKKATQEKWNVKLCFAERFANPGETKILSPGERGCAHSHRRAWEYAAARKEPTLVLEDDVQFIFERSDPSLGQFNGQLFTQRLQLAMAEAPKDFDVLYLGWAGYRGGNFWNHKGKDTGKAIRRVEYVYTTVAYVISQKAAKQLLRRANPIDQPVDNFMAWEASQKKLKSFVILDKGDADDLWAGGIVDQFDFAGDSDISKSDGSTIQGNFVEGEPVTN